MRKRFKSALQEKLCRSKDYDKTLREQVQGDGIENQRSYRTLKNGDLSKRKRMLKEYEIQSHANAMGDTEFEQKEDANELRNYIADQLSMAHVQVFVEDVFTELGSTVNVDFSDWKAANAVSFFLAIQCLSNERYNAFIYSLTGGEHELVKSFDDILWDDLLSLVQQTAEVVQATCASTEGEEGVEEETIKHVIKPKKGYVSEVAKRPVHSLGNTFKKVKRILEG
jgi:hypothetical protein